MKIFSTIMLAIILATAGVFALGCDDDKENKGNPNDDRPITGDISDEAGDKGNNDVDDSEQQNEDLVIPLTELDEIEVKFFGITVDHTYMEVMAFTVGSEYRTAFNTCQVCYGSRKAYFLQIDDNTLQCQNCGYKFDLSSVGVANGGRTCSPYPILDSDRTITDENIVIAKDFFLSAKALFKTWKVV